LREVDSRRLHFPGHAAQSIGMLLVARAGGGVPRRARLAAAQTGATRSRPDDAAV